jgi:curved DNA-binding protein CbpA
MNFQIEQGLFAFDFTDHHAILGVGVNGSEEQIRDRYKEVARLLHPDGRHWENPSDREMSVQLFSRLVTHAYAQLSRANQRKEQILMLDLLAKRLVADASQIKLTNGAAQKLYSGNGNLDEEYHLLLNDLNRKQYLNPTESLVITGQISELNMIYLLRRENQKIRSQHIAPSSTATIQPDTKSFEQPKPSAAEGSLRRADEYINMRNWVKASIELREAIKIDPNNVRSHSLLGISYLRQDQITMAKIHINKAIQLDPRHPEAIKAKQELDKLSGSQKTTKSSSPKSGNNPFGGFFGKK